MAPAANAPSMQLMARDYAQVLEALKAAADTKGHERRTASRIEVQAQVTVFSVTEGKPGPAFTCLTRDLSFRGVGLFQARPVERGSQFVVALPRLNATPLTLLCTVMYCREMADGLYNVGASFNSPLDLQVAPGAGGAVAPGNAPGEAEMARIRQSILG